MREVTDSGKTGDSGSASATAKVRVLFVTWDGPQVHYLETLFLPIFRKLQGKGFAFHVLQFTWQGEGGALESQLARCEEAGIPYRSVPVWRRPRSLGAFATAFLGNRHVARYIRDHHIDIVMPRSIFAAMATIRAAGQVPVRYLYDSDGLALDERVDFDGWNPSNFRYRFLRRVEAKAIRRADHILTRSSSAIDILAGRGGQGVSSDRFSVVVNGRDEKKFAPVSREVRDSVRRELGVEEDGLLLVYAGSVGKQYCIDEMLELFRRVRQLNAKSRLLLLTGDVRALENCLAKYEEEKRFCCCQRLLPDEVPRYLAASDIGLALRMPSFSMKAVDPVKIGEYLLCGVPVIATAGIGDTSEYLDDEVGLVLRSHSADSLAEAAKWIVNEAVPNADAFRESCRKRGLQRFALSSAAEGYERALRLASQV